MFVLALVFACTGGDPAADTDNDESDTDTSDTSDTSDTDTSDTDTGCVPTPPEGLAIVGDALPRSVVATWQPGACPASSWEIAIGASAADDLVPWRTVNATTFSDLLDTRLPSDTALTFSVRNVGSDAPISVAFQLWTPAGIPGMVAWYDWADTDTLFSDVGCSVPAEGGDEIRCALDKSGNANTMYGDPSFDAPLLGTLSGYTAAIFRGGRILYSPHSPSNAITGSALYLAVLDAPDEVGSVESSVYHYPLNKEGAYEFAYGAGEFRAAIETDAPGRWAWAGPSVEATPALQLNTFATDGTMWTFRRDGALLGEVSPGNAQTGNIIEGYFEYGGTIITQTPLVIGGRPLNITLSYEADQAELLLFEAVPSESQQALLEAWMMQKWGL